MPPWTGTNHDPDPPPTPPTGAGRTRWFGVDLLRGIAILAMVAVHFVQWGYETVPEAAPHILVGHFFGGLAAPLFLTIVGIGVVFSQRARRARGEPAHRIHRHLLLRGLVILGVGYLLNALEAPLYGFWAMEILHCIGLSIIICYLCLRLPGWSRLVLAGVVIALAPLARTALGYPIPFEWTFPHQIDSVPSFLEGILATGYYPLLPWLAFPLVGTIIGDALLRCNPVHTEAEQVRQAIASAWRRTAILMLAIATAAIVIGTVSYTTGGAVDIFPATTVYMTIMLAATLLLAVLVIWLFDIRALSHRALTPLAALGKIALTTYIVHHFVGYNLTAALGWRYANLATETTCLIITFNGLMLVLATGLDRIRQRYTLEWLLRKL